MASFDIQRSSEVPITAISNLCVSPYYCLIFSKEEIEKCKKRDMLEQLLADLTGEYPAFGEVFLDERDIFLTHSLQAAATSMLIPDRKLNIIYISKC